LFSFQTLSRCEQITDEGVRYISSSVSAQENLHVLELDNCPSITDISIDHLLACQNLQRLDIFDCQQITKNAVKKFQVFYFNHKNSILIDVL
jgi:F-box/leucine-rich repeat protein 2/20